MCAAPGVCPQRRIRTRQGRPRRRCRRWCRIFVWDRGIEERCRIQVSDFRLGQRNRGTVSDSASLPSPPSRRRAAYKNFGGVGWGRGASDVCPGRRIPGRQGLPWASDPQTAGSPLGVGPPNGRVSPGRRIPKTAGFPPGVGVHRFPRGVSEHSPRHVGWDGRVSLGCRVRRQGRPCRHRRTPGDREGTPVATSPQKARGRGLGRGRAGEAWIDLDTWEDR
jgi:hypothetical protein